MRKDKRGAIPHIEQKKLVIKLRDDGYSFTEIAEALNLKHRALAYFHYKTAKKYGLVSGSK